MIFVWRKSIHALSASHSTILEEEEEEEEEEEYSPITQEYKTKTKAHSNTKKYNRDTAGRTIRCSFMTHATLFFVAGWEE